LYSTQAAISQVRTPPGSNEHPPRVVDRAEMPIERFNCGRLKDRGRVAQLVEQCPFKAWVAGSNPAALTMFARSGPDTWVTECTGYMGNTFGPKGFSSGSKTLVSKSKYPRSYCIKLTNQMSSCTS